MFPDAFIEEQAAIYLRVGAPLTARPGEQFHPMPFAEFLEFRELMARPLRRPPADERRRRALRR